MEKPQAALNGLTPQQAVIEWRYIPATVKRVERLQWTTMAFVAGASAALGWKMYAPAPPVHAALAVFWRWLGGA